jgi:hypothetical protein
LFGLFLILEGHAGHLGSEAVHLDVSLHRPIIGAASSSSTMTASTFFGATLSETASQRVSPGTFPGRNGKTSLRSEQAMSPKDCGFRLTAPTTPVSERFL